MSEFGEVKGPLPFITGEYIPNSRTTLGLDQLLPLVDDREVTLIPRSFREIQMRLQKDANTVLAESIDKKFGLTGLFYAELSHPDSRPIVFAGFGNYKDLMVGSLNKAIAFIDLERSTGIGWSGDVGVRLNGRLLPVSIDISGVDQQTKRIVSVGYDAEYDFSMEKNPSGKITFILDEVGISVSREDGFEFKEGHGTLDTLPYNYTIQYTHGVFTEEMLRTIGENKIQKPTNRINIGRYLRFGQSRAECKLLLQSPILTELENYPEDFYNVVGSDGMVRIGRKGLWEIHLPNTLPARATTPKFLKRYK